MKKLIYLFITGILIVSCSKDDDRVPLIFEGKWNLVEFYNSGEREVYQPGDITWDFNKYDELVVAMDTILPVTSNLPVKTPGTYKYVATNEVMSLEGIQYAIQIDNGFLLLDHNSSANGTAIRLIKVSE